MPTITLSAIAKSFGSGPPAVDDLDLVIPDGAFMCLLGPSGCGKTTTLRMIAGLEQPTAGRIEVGARVLDSVPDGTFVPAEKRGMGLVFQSYALWPHLTVRGNIEFGLQMRKVPAADRDRRVDEVMRLLRIVGLGDRYPSQLSGGQQQRVALARMLAVEPEVLLLDEPLSNLDAQLRLEMRAELKRVHEATGATIVFVTHDQLEAMTMGTHTAVLSEGKLQQLGPPLEVYHRPANIFVAQFVGSPPMNVVAVDPGGDSERDGATGPGELGAALGGYLTRMLADPVGVGWVGIRPESLRVSTTPDEVPAGAWWEPAEVGAVLPAGSSWTMRVRIRDREMFALYFTDLALRAHDEIICWVHPGDLHVFGGDGRRAPAWDTATTRQAV